MICIHAQKHVRPGVRVCPHFGRTDFAKDTDGNRCPCGTLCVKYAPGGEPAPAPETPKLGPGSILAAKLRAMRVPGCSACHALAKKMDAWGPDVCRERLDEIVTAIEANATARLSGATSGTLEKAAAMAPRARRLIIRKLVRDAIRKAHKA